MEEDNLNLDVHEIPTVKREEKSRWSKLKDDVIGVTVAYLMLPFVAIFGWPFPH